nr:DNA-binding protein [Pseudomonadota bacterium]
MATAKKTPAPVVKKAVKAAAPAKTTKAPAKAVKAAPAKAPKAAVKAAPAKAVKAAAAAPAANKPIKTAFNKSSLTAHIATQAAVEPKLVK